MNGDQPDRKDSGSPFGFDGPITLSVFAPDTNPIDGEAIPGSWRPVGTVVGGSVPAARPVDRDLFADAGPEQLRAITGCGSVRFSISVDCGPLVTALEGAHRAVRDLGKAVGESIVGIRAEFRDNRDPFGFKRAMLEIERAQLVKLPSLTVADKYRMRRVWHALARSQRNQANGTRRKANGRLQRRTARDRGVT